MEYSPSLNTTEDVRYEPEVGLMNAYNSYERGSLSLSEVLARLPESRLRELAQDWKKMEGNLKGRVDELVANGIGSNPRSDAAMTSLRQLAQSAELSRELFELALEASPLNPEKPRFKQILDQMDRTMRKQSAIAYQLSLQI